MFVIYFSFFFLFNPLASPGEGASVFTCPYLSAGAPAPEEAKGLIVIYIKYISRCSIIKN